MESAYIIKSSEGYYIGPRFYDWTRRESLALRFTHSEVKEVVKDLTSIGHRCEVWRVDL
ncbi:hypothetical protein [Chengkuizengella marina]|uniref:hypothetical protein n=1 Tax=Chengkuizengella marina TaxID=2507566 RepID=UPI0013695C76|nr:hypothetical protein [Chengkuizengella marina]